ncbi:hypothetical protein ABIC29_001231 [Agromyces sp. PvR057]
MTLRLDPALPLVWRTAEDLQVGAATPVAVFERAGDVEAGLIAALRHGVSRSTLVSIGSGLGATPERVHEFVRRLAAGLVDASPNPTSGAQDAASVRAARPARPERADAAAARPRIVGLDGSGPIADLLAANLAFLGHEVLPLAPRTLDVRAPDPARAEPDLVVIVAAWAVTPARHLPWLRRDLPHLAVVSDDAGIRVGPFVEPGRGPCLRCLDLSARDADAAWPVIAAQLAGRPAPADPPRLRFDAAALAAAAVDARLGAAPHDAELDGGLAERTGADTVRLAAASVSFDRRGSVGRRREHAEHPSCGCRAPAGIAIAHALPVAARRAAPSSATAAAVPA